MPTALIALILELLPVAETLGRTISRAIAKARQAGELTAAQEAEFLQRLGDVFSQPYAQPSDPVYRGPAEYSELPPAASTIPTPP